ncbi:MAG: hypothetical protein AAB897_03460 [Patescibacteria group bacterium]
MSRTSKRITLVLVLVLLAGGGYFLGQFLGITGGIPAEFTNARLQGALVAQNIVNLSNESVLDLAEINKLDQNRNYTEALNLATEVIRQSQEIRDQAVLLASEVEKMTKALSEIDSFEARQAALESIANRLALISRLINYSGYLGQLLDVLSSRFTGGHAPYGEAGRLIDQINSEVRAINNFNNQATQAMERFDTAVND